MIPEAIFLKEDPHQFQFDVGGVAGERFGHLLSRIHADSPQKQFAIGFPEYSENSLGRELRLFTETRLDSLDIIRGPETSCYILSFLLPLFLGILTLHFFCRITNSTFYYSA